jgi:hypothetical protein
MLRRPASTLATTRHSKRVPGRSPPRVLLINPSVTSREASGERAAPRDATEVLGGQTVISGELNDEVTYVALANSWIIINVGGGPTDDKRPSRSRRPRPRSGEQLPPHPGCGHPSCVRQVERAGRPIPDAADAARDRDPLLHPRSRRLPDRGGSDDSAQRLASSILTTERSGRSTPELRPRLVKPNSVTDATCSSPRESARLSSPTCWSGQALGLGL